MRFTRHSIGFPHRLESEDHARPWFCPRLVRFFYVLGFPIGLSPWTMQGLGSVQDLEDFIFSTISPYTRAGKVGLRLEAPRDARALSTARRSP